MTKYQTAAFAVILTILAGGRSFAESPARYGVGVYGGAALPIMGKRIREITDNGGHIGFIVRRSMAPRWEAAISVERLNVQRVDVTPFLFSAIYTFAPEAVVTPVARLGFGVARVHGVGGPTDMDERLAFKPGIALEGRISRDFRLSGYADFLWSPQASHDDKIFGAFTPGVLLTYFFGATSAATVKAPPEPVVEDSPADESPAALPPGEKVRITLNVEFDTDKSEVKEQFRGRIKKVADFMQAYPDTTAEIEGHTDNVGDAAYNRALSGRRAESVMSYLIEEFEIKEERLSAVGYGPDQPVASNATKAGRSQNRRVVATLSAVKE
ncbi:MAG: OmpA family protein [Elusimicrobiota bacterium]